MGYKHLSAEKDSLSNAFEQWGQCYKLFFQYCYSSFMHEMYCGYAWNVLWENLKVCNSVSQSKSLSKISEAYHKNDKSTKYKCQKV